MIIIALAVIVYLVHPPPKTFSVLDCKLRKSTKKFNLINFLLVQTSFSLDVSASGEGQASAMFMNTLEPISH